MSGKGRHAADPADRAVLVRAGDGAEVSEGVDVWGAMFVLRDGLLHLDGSWSFTMLEDAELGDLRVSAMGLMTGLRGEAGMKVKKGEFVTLNSLTVTMLPDAENAP